MFIGDVRIADGDQLESADAALEILPGGTLFRKDVIRVVSPLSISVLAANDFGSVKIVDLPPTNLQFFGAQVDLVIQGTGGVAGSLGSVDLALGQVATASVDFTNVGEDNVIVAVSATAGGLVKGGGFIAGFSLFAAQGVSPEIFLNAGINPGVADGTIEVVSGTITLVYFDVGLTPS